MSFYPIIKIPAPIERAYRSEPVFAQVDVTKSVPMAVVPRRFNLLMLAVEAGLATVISGISWSLYSLPASGLILLGGIVLAAVHALLMHLTYPERWYLYHEQVDLYRKQQWEDEFNQSRVARLQTTDGIARYRRQKVLAVLAHTKVTRQESRPLSEAAEKFADVLAQWLPNRLQTHAGLVLVDQESNLHMQIEIDEPYQNINGDIQVTHYADSPTDRQANELWLEQGWVVVRFSAEQVTGYADSCCKVIAEVVAELLQDESWLSSFAEVDNLTAVPQWTEFEAHRLAKLAQRQYA